MNKQEVFNDKRKIIEGILLEGYSIFENDLENDKNYSLSTDEIAELYYDLIRMELDRIGVK